ncbi:diguanylate cyclase domain protein, partial [Vibrio parahaemolyticus V-223/04]
IPSAMTRVTRC